MRPRLFRDADAQIAFDFSFILAKKHPLDKFYLRVFQIRNESDALFVASVMRLSANNLHGTHGLGQDLHLVLELHTLGTLENIPFVRGYIARREIVQRNHHHVRAAAVAHTDLGILRRKAFQHMRDSILHVVLKR